jgi:hypothetical protein
VILSLLSNSNLRRALPLILAALLVHISPFTALAAAVRSADAVCTNTPPGAAAALAPASADVVIVIDRAADIAAAPRGRAALRVLQEFGLFADSAIAWNELAAALGMNPDEALRAVAGERVMLIIRAETAESPSAWALITHVAPQTERLIRERLKPVPKHIAHGQPVLMLENGRFLLATRADRASRDRGGQAALLIASSHASDLFEACLPILSGKPAANPLSADPLASLACAPLPPNQPQPQAQPQPHPAHEPDAFILYRPRLTAEPDAPRTLLTITCSSAPDFAEGWIATVACAPNFLGDPASVAQPGTPEPLFRAAAEHAVLAFAAPVSSNRDVGSGFARILYRFMSDVAPLFQGQGLVSLRERPTGAHTPPALELLIGSALRPALEVKADFDGGMSSLINRLTRADLALLEAHDFEGRFPAAVREADLSPRSLSLLGPMIGPAPVARWCFADPDRGDDPTWWLAQIAARVPGSDGSALRAVAATLTPDPEGVVGEPPVARYTTIGLIRPDAMHRLFPPVIRTVAPVLAPLRWTQSIEWRAALHDDGLVRGTASLRFLPEAAEPAERLDSR